MRLAASAPPAAAPTPRGALRQGHGQQQTGVRACEYLVDLDLKHCQDLQRDANNDAQGGGDLRLRRPHRYLQRAGSISGSAQRSASQ